jgi:hypothetical protein
MTEFQMLLLLVGVHLLGFIAIAVLAIPAMRENNEGTDDEDSSGSDDGWGNRPNSKPDPTLWPGGGIPLPDAEQSSVRLRGPGRLSDRTRRHERRPVRDPQRLPSRIPSRS